MIETEQTRSGVLTFNEVITSDQTKRYRGLQWMLLEHWTPQYCVLMPKRIPAPEFLKWRSEFATGKSVETLYSEGVYLFSEYDDALMFFLTWGGRAE